MTDKILLQYWVEAAQKSINTIASVVDDHVLGNNACALETININLQHISNSLHEDILDNYKNMLRSKIREVRNDAILIFGNYKQKNNMNHLIVNFRQSCSKLKSAIVSSNNYTKLQNSNRI